MSVFKGTLCPRNRLKGQNSSRIVIDVIERMCFLSSALNCQAGSLNLLDLLIGGIMSPPSLEVRVKSLCQDFSSLLPENNTTEMFTLS